MHPTGGSLRVFKPFAWLRVGSGKVALSRPTHQRVTQAVRQLAAVRKCSYNLVTLFPAIILWGDGVMETRSFESLLGFDSQAPKGIRNLVSFGASESAK